MGSIGFKDNIRIPEEIFDRITSVDSFEEALDFDEASKELFLLVKETTPLTEGIIRLEKMQVVAFSSLIHSILDVVEFRTESYVEGVLSRADYCDIKDLIDEVQSYIDKEYHYFQIIKDKFSSENCEIPISILKDESLFQYYFSLQSAHKLESCKRDLEKRLRALNPPKIKRSDFNQVITSPYVAASSELTDCFDLRSLLNKDYKISNKVCREIGVKKELILEFLDDLVDLLNDDNCPKELFDIFYSLFCLSLPRMISNRRYSFFKRVNTENTSKVQNALNNYKTYKKAGCFIEVVK